MRFTQHPILDFSQDRKRRASFTYNGKKIEGYDNETIASALHASGVKILSKSSIHLRPRGFYCAIGKCASCLMTVDGIPNVKTCMMLVQEGMQVESQEGSATLPDMMPKKGKKEPMETEVTVVGGGPAGLSAAVEAAKHNKVILIDENYTLGGQLIKQTHKFFGSKDQGASVRGIKIAEDLSREVSENKNITVLLNSSLVGYYYEKGHSLTAVKDNERLIKLKTETIIVATGASENVIVFENNDLPGIYGAGAAQTLMNVYGVKPGDKVLMIGAGNVGLIVSYQLLQAEVDVVCVVEALAKIGGYNVHAAKLRRCGVPILTRHSILKAYGDETLKGATIVALDKNWNPIKGSEKDIEADVICLAVGLSPSIELLRQAGCSTKYIPELGGNVIVHNKYLETDIKGIYIAGDCSGIGEASTAMLEGRIAGLSAALHIKKNKQVEHRRGVLIDDLQDLREGPFGEKPRVGKERLFGAIQ